VVWLPRAPRGWPAEIGAEMTTQRIIQAALPSPSRHIYNPLTIAIAFRRSGAFDRPWQHPVKVDGTFA
jgi:hypothetical protein